MERKKKEKAETNAKLETDSYWEESGDSPPTKHAHNNSVVNTLSDSVGKVTEGLIGFVAGRKGETEDEGDDAAAKKLEEAGGKMSTASGMNRYDAVCEYAASVVSA